MNRRLYVIFMGILPVVIALICGGLVILFTGGNPFRTYWLLARESFGNWTSIRNTLIASTALLFTSTATAIGFRAGVFTLSAEGAFISGGFAAAVAGAFTMNIAGWQGIVLLLLVGSIVGAAVSLIPAMLKAYLDVDEVVSTLMFNFVIAGLVTWLVQSFFLAPNEDHPFCNVVDRSYRRNWWRCSFVWTCTQVCIRILRGLWIYWTGDSTTSEVQTDGFDRRVFATRCN